MKYTNENFTTMTVITLCYHTEFLAFDVPMSIAMLSSSSLRKPFSQQTADGKLNT